MEIGAFRMSVVASVYALNFGLAFMLRLRGLRALETSLKLETEGASPFTSYSIVSIA